MKKHDPIARARALNANLRVRAVLERTQERNLILAHLRCAWKQEGLWRLLDALLEVERGEHRLNGQSRPEPAPVPPAPSPAGPVAPNGHAAAPAEPSAGTDGAPLHSQPESHLPRPDGRWSDPHC
jgi:hypothetical protein